jgi:hypothetical protein
MTSLGTVVPVVVASQRGDAANEIVLYAKGHNVASSCSAPTAAPA